MYNLTKLIRAPAINIAKRGIATHGHYANSIKGKPCMTTCPKARMCKQRGGGKHNAAAFDRMTSSGHPLLRGQPHMISPADGRHMSTSVLRIIAPGAGVVIKSRIEQYQHWVAGAIALGAAVSAAAVAEHYSESGNQQYNEQTIDDARFLQRTFGIQIGSLVQGNNGRQFRIVSLMPTVACRSVLYRVKDLQNPADELILKIAEADEVPDDRKGHQGTAHSEILALEELGAKHENIVELRDWMAFGEQKEWYGMVMEYLPHSEPTQFEDKVAYVKGVLNGLTACHDENMVHRDIKRGNVMYDKTKKRAVLIDFDAAARTGTEGVLGGLIFRCGTKGYRAPEMDGETIYHDKVDIWSVGVILAEMILDVRVQSVTEFPHESADVRDTLSSRLSEVRSKLESRMAGGEQLSAQEMKMLQGIELAMNMIDNDPAARVSAHEALAHPFFKQ